MDAPAGHSFEAHILQRMLLMKARPLPARPAGLNTVLLHATKKRTHLSHSEYPDRRQA